MKTVMLIFMLVITPMSYAWNATGHHIIAQIAYDHLTPAAKRKVNAINRRFSPQSKHAQFVWAASWADRLRGGKYERYEGWHYIDWPYTTDNTPVQQPDIYNILWAIQHTSRHLEDPFNLRFYIHLVGDVHQPLHTIDRYSKLFPNGDQGGNRVLIHSKYAKKLHQYWDRSAGYFQDQYPHSRWTHQQLKKVAKSIEAEYPPSRLQNLNVMEPHRWAQESHQLAIEKVYQISSGETPTPEYERSSRELIKQQLALAGYRLAAALNYLLVKV